MKNSIIKHYVINGKDFSIVRSVSENNTEYINEVHIYNGLNAIYRKITYTCKRSHMNDLIRYNGMLATDTIKFINNL